MVLGVPILSLNIFIQNFSNMQHIFYTIHSIWDWNESKMLTEFLSLIEFLSLESQYLNTSGYVYMEIYGKLSLNYPCYPSYLLLFQFS